MPRETAEDNGALLSRLSNELVRTKKETWGKGPEAAKSYMFDDMLFIVMRGGLTPAEETMLSFDRPDTVRAMRQEYQNEMTAPMIGKVEELTKRKVLTYQSQVMFDPAVVVEMFVFDGSTPEGARAATADGQLSAGDVGEATVADADPS